MAAGLGFIEFTTGDVLTAAAANGYLASQVVMVFADSAARTTAITSPQEGMISFLKDTNAVQAYDGAAWVGIGGGSSPLTTKGDLYTFDTADARLGVGTDGHTLVADSVEATGLKWVAPSAGGGMTSLATGSLSGASTSISGISGSYKSLKLVLVGWYASNVDATMSFNSDTSSNYQQQFVKSADNSISTGGGSATKMYLHQQGGSTSNTTAVAVLDVDDYSNASFGKIWNLNNYYVASNNSTKVMEMQSGFFASNTAITSN
jgi:hypothetical protein